MSEPANLSLVALTPQEVAPAQAQLADWCRQKMISLGQEYRDLNDNLTIAKRNRWRTTALKPAVAKLKKRIQYYQKMRAAVQAGYLIIPNLPIEIIAVRVDRQSPQFATAKWPSNINEAKPELLALGTGRYVDETLPHQTATRAVYDDKGVVKRDSAGNVVRESYASVGFSFTEEIDFPVVAVKPIILEATERALKQQIFDRIGVAFGSDTQTVASGKRRRSDPMVIGQLIDPRSTTYSKKFVSFFVAWWLSTDVL